MVKFIQQNIDKKKRAKVVCASNSNFECLKPDLEMKIKGTRYLIDVNWCLKDENLEQRFQSKIEKYAKEAEIH